MRKLLLLPVVLLLSLALFAQEKVDMEMLNKIRNEGLNNSQVMDIALHLTEVSGARLTNSSGFFRAANWAVSELKKMGLENAKLEPWGDFGKGWDLEKSYVAMTAPYYRPLIAYPKAWTSGTTGLQNAEVMVIKAQDTTDLESAKGKLKGKIVMLYTSDEYKQSFEPDAARYTDEELAKMANPEPRENRQRQFDTARIRQFRAARAIPNKLKEMAEAEGAVAILSYSSRGHDGTIFVQGGGSYGLNDPANFPDIVIALEDYLSICHLSDAGVPVRLEMDIKTKFKTDDIKGYDVIAEIKGTDPKLKDQIVMLGGHLDSWHSGTGATDNAAGCSVMMEVVRIIKTLGIKPKRTIRIALWSGEEEGLLGSRGYAKNHFADVGEDGKWIIKPEQSKVSAYYNIDNGTGKIRGVYLQGNEKVKDIFAEWLKPFNDLGAATLSPSNTGGTDHLSFDAVGIPGFQFIQDEIEYSTRTHHTNMDRYDHLVTDDMKQIATIVASFVYNTAQRDEMMPRKDMPEPPRQRRMF